MAFVVAVMRASTTRAPGPGAAIRQSLTPGTARRAAATASASAARQSALTCGPASMVKKTAVPRARSACTQSIAASVAGFQ